MGPFLSFPFLSFPFLSFPFLSFPFLSPIMLSSSPTTDPSFLPPFLPSFLPSFYSNFVKATFYALQKTYGYLSPDLWSETQLGRTPYQEHTDFLAMGRTGGHKKRVRDL